jgi:hypothetical protein
MTTNKNKTRLTSVRLGMSSDEGLRIGGRSASNEFEGKIDKHG